jgi:hypothetical protein
MARMGRLALTTTMTVDALIDVGEWFVADGEHDRVAQEQFEEAAAMIALGRWITRRAADAAPAIAPGAKSHTIGTVRP